MNRLIAKNLGVIIFLVVLAFIAIASEASAGSTEGSWDFQCSKHGYNKYKNCGSNEQLFANGETFYAAATSYQFLGHRHGGSFIQVSVCIYLGGESQCDPWSCSGDDCGEEYGGEDPWKLLPGGEGGMTVWDNSTWGKVYYFAEVQDAEVRNRGSWSASFVDPPPPPPPDPVTVNLNFYVKNQNNQPIGGADVHIEQDFGNGTDHSSDGNGFANFDVAPNITLGYYVSAANCTGPVSPYGVNGSIWTDGGATTNVTLTCSVDNPPPGAAVDIKANNSNGPITLVWNSSANLSWTSTNASSCTASGDWSGSKAVNSSQSTGNLTLPKTYNYTLACSGNGSVSDTVQIILNPPIPNDPTSVTVTEPDYCMSGPAITVGWTYSDPSGSPQQSYQVQLDDNPAFNSIDVDSGKLNSNSTSWFSGQGLLQFNKDYKARVRVWNGYDVVSGWTESTICNGPGCIGSSGKWNTPPYAYPQVDFYWTANGILNNPSPPVNKPVSFTDQTLFNGPSGSREWDWLFGDGSSSTQQNPAKTYTTEGSYYVTLTATDNANQTCVRTKGPLIIQKPIPQWREVAPR